MNADFICIDLNCIYLCIIYGLLATCLDKLDGDFCILHYNKKLNDNLKRNVLKCESVDGWDSLYLC